MLARGVEDAAGRGEVRMFKAKGSGVVLCGWLWFPWQCVEQGLAGWIGGLVDWLVAWSLGRAWNWILVVEPLFVVAGTIS